MRNYPPCFPPLIIRRRTISNPLRYEQWLATNVFEQKQKGFYGVYIKVPVGDIPTTIARKLVDAIKPYVADEIRITQNQGLF
jgi:sulfite reductase (ferredoxin)